MAIFTIVPLIGSTSMYLSSFVFVLYIVGDRVIARWTDNHYYAGKVTHISERFKNISVLFDDGGKITHPMLDVTAVFADTEPTSINYKDHVIAPWEGSYTQYFGFVVEMDPDGTFKVLFDDHSEAWYTKDKVRILPETSSPHDGE